MLQPMEKPCATSLMIQGIWRVSGTFPPDRGV
jgi:hypothetical protein